MKNLIYLAILLFTLISCSGGGSDGDNSAPSVPTLTAPENNKLCLDNILSFQWNISSDPENDAITYQIQIAKDNQFMQIVKMADKISDKYYIVTLEKNTAYYWRMKSTDTKGLSSEYSSIYKFYTSGDAVVNHLPFAPELVNPLINSYVNASTTTLTWNASDVDAMDILEYDVYFGTTYLPTTKISSNLSTKTAVVNIVSGKQYFWRVVVRDNKGGETEGQVWKFKGN